MSTNNEIWSLVHKKRFERTIKSHGECRELILKASEETSVSMTPEGVPSTPDAVGPEEFEEGDSQVSETNTQSQKEKVSETKTLSQDKSVSETNTLSQEESVSREKGAGCESR